MSTPFQFKQFSIYQDKCAMKVGTDGVLLGAWAKPIEGDLLDVGCGTGLIALMMAQRVGDAKIDAIDIDEHSYQQTLGNVANSKWKDKIDVFHTDLQSFNPNTKYNHIFSNPPYFIQSYKALDKARNTARHTDSLSFEDLIVNVVRLLDKDGIFSLILPVVEAQKLTTIALGNGLFLNRKCDVKPNKMKPVKRILMEFSFNSVEVVSEELTIETDKRHQYTKEYISLTQDFYLYDR